MTWPASIHTRQAGKEVPRGRQRADIVAVDMIGVSETHHALGLIRRRKEPLAAP